MSLTGRANISRPEPPHPVGPDPKNFTKSSRWVSKISRFEQNRLDRLGHVLLLAALVYMLHELSPTKLTLSWGFPVSRPKIPLSPRMREGVWTFASYCPLRRL